MNIKITGMRTMADSLRDSAPRAQPTIPSVARAALPSVSMSSSFTSLAASAGGAVSLGDAPPVLQLRRFANRDQVRQWLPGNGFSRLGSGSVSDAFTDGSWVVKVLKTSSFQNGSQTGARVPFLTDRTLRTINTLRAGLPSHLAPLINETVSPVPGVFVQRLVRGLTFGALSAAGRAEALQSIADLRGAAEKVVPRAELDIENPENFIFTTTTPHRIVSYFDPASNFIPQSIPAT